MSWVQSPVVGGENQLLQVVLWPPRSLATGAHIHTHNKINNCNKNIQFYKYLIGKGTTQTKFIFSAPPDSLETSLNISKNVHQTELQKLVDLVKESALKEQGEWVRTTEQSALGWQPLLSVAFQEGKEGALGQACGWLIRRLRQDWLKTQS